MVLLVFWEGLYLTWASSLPGFRDGARPALVVEAGGVVREACPRARAAGVMPGMAVPVARRLLQEAGLAVVARDHWGVLPFVERFRYACTALSPAVEPVGERAVLIDLGPRGEPVEAVARLAGGLMGEGRIVAGAGASRGVAHAAARLARAWAERGRSDGRGTAGEPAPLFVRRAEEGASLPFYVVAVLPGADRDFLAPLPLTALPVPAAAAAVLARRGVRTCGELLALPPGLLTGAVGPALGGELLALCRGEGGTPVKPAWPPPEVVWRSADGVRPGEPLWREAASAVASGLRERDSGFLELHLEWEGGDGLYRARRWLTRPVRDATEIALLLSVLAGEVAAVARQAAAGEAADLEGRYVVRARRLTPVRRRQLSFLEPEEPLREGRAEALSRAVGVLGLRLGRTATGWAGESDPQGSSCLSAGGSLLARERRLGFWDPRRWPAADGLARPRSGPGSR